MNGKYITCIGNKIKNNLLAINRLSRFYGEKKMVKKDLSYSDLKDLVDIKNDLLQLKTETNDKVKLNLIDETLDSVNKLIKAVENTLQQLELLGGGV